LTEDAVVEWLLEGDAAIRWQVLRDLLDAPAREWEAERARTVEEGMLAHRLYRSDKTGEVITERFTSRLTRDDLDWTARSFLCAPDDHGEGLEVRPLVGSPGDFASRAVRSRSIRRNRSTLRYGTSTSTCWRRTSHAGDSA
jgi:hypothetical protein